MSRDKKQTIRCAIYTRKSTEDGLDMEFNSLDAQREAAEAYIKSQLHEGWMLIPTRYDDGGFSGGSMDRPAVTQLMADIEAGKIDMIVVYKVDRLSRSLHDFAKMVERFDAHGVSFVSVTQQFNTSTSMGRLTLNMLLSFAQFEREVTAERIRDKFAASKKKGMWMGGRVPLGYDVIDRKLVVNHTEAAWVQEIFAGYLRLRSVDQLLGVLTSRGITHKRTRNGLAVASAPLTRNVLYSILKHPVYIGKIHHNGELYEGQHEAIIVLEVWEQAQALLASQARSKEGRYNSNVALLKGKLVDIEGRRYRFHVAERKKNRQYRYYFQPETKHRMPMRLIETAITSMLSHPELESHLGLNEAQYLQWRKWLLQNPADLVTPFITKITLGKDSTVIHMKLEGLATHLEAKPINPLPLPPSEEELLPITIIQRDGSLEITLHQSFMKASAIAKASRHNKTLLNAIGQAYRWQQMLNKNQELTQRQLAKEHAVDARYLTRALHLLLLAPDILTSILKGTQPEHLSLATFRNINLPVYWNEQRQLLGFQPQ
jgi:site-specific DNA recombinase